MGKIAKTLYVRSNGCDVAPMVAKKTAPKPSKRAPGKVTGAIQRKSTHGIHGNRGSIWPALSTAYGGNVKLAEAIGVAYNTVYRWAVKGELVPLAMARLVGMLAAAKGIQSPVSAVTKAE